MMKKFLVALLCVIFVSGCAFTDAQKATVAKGVLQTIYSSGGAYKIGAEIDKRVAAGKLSAAEGAELKLLAQRDYENVLAMLDLLSSGEEELPVFSSDAGVGSEAK